MGFVPVDYGGGVITDPTNGGWNSPPLRQGVTWGQGWKSPGAGRTSQQAWDTGQRDNLDPWWNYGSKSANPYLQDWRQNPQFATFLNGDQANYFEEGMAPEQQYDTVAGALWGANRLANPFQSFLASRIGRNESAWKAQEAANALANPGYKSNSYAEYLGNRYITGTTAPQTGGYGNDSVQGQRDTDVKNLIKLAQSGPGGSTGGMSQQAAEITLANILGQSLSAPARAALNSRLDQLNTQYQQEIASLGPTAGMTYFRYALQRLGILDGQGRAPGDAGYGT